MTREQMNIVIVGHVDHGKSTVIGRLLADTGSLPQGKLQEVKDSCARNSKPFEYAFLLDALKDEQAQGITIDTARCFFSSRKRDYIILDAPGHIEFLKNMVTGASRAEAGLLVIDAHEGIRENSRRHGHMISLLGIKQVSILVNKMDLVDYDKDVFTRIQEEFSLFLKEVNIEPISFIPISAMGGDNIISPSENTPWYQGPSVLEQVDLFAKTKESDNLPFRMSVQDIYKFTAAGDDRRIVAGTVEAGSIGPGEEVIFLPSGKESRIRSLEGFNVPERAEVRAGEAVGFTLDTQIYIRSGELMVRKRDPQPRVASRFKANLFWVGLSPMVQGKDYKLKIGAAKAQVRLVKVLSVLDTSDLSSDSTKLQIDRHDVAECLFETTKPIAFDPAGQRETSGRFVIVDNYEISGGGIIIDKDDSGESYLVREIQERETFWEKGPISVHDRAAYYGHKSRFIIFTGDEETKKKEIAHELEGRLFKKNLIAYYLGLGSIDRGIDADIDSNEADGPERIRRLGELARILTDSGQIFITTVSDVDDYDLKRLKMLNEPNDILVVNVGTNHFSDFPVNIELNGSEGNQTAIEQIYQILKEEDIIPDYTI
ncbi:MAG: GTP-binding protein [Spirochaetales bacterium]|nr:GTP-binding protein [Spirochaetales bacterium]